MCKRLIADTFKKYNWKRALITVFIVGSLILGVGLPIFAPLGIEAFLSWASIIIVLYAVWISAQSLSLSRASQRPFLNISRIYAQFDGDGINPSPIRYFIISVDNTGNFPADQVSISFDMWKTSNNDKHQLILKGNETMIYFPNEGNSNLFFLEADSENKLIMNVGEKLQVRIEINYHNKLTQGKHKTVRSYMAEYNKTAAHDPVPVPEEDNWE